MPIEGRAPDKAKFENLPPDQVIKSSLLPMPETVRVCDIESREEYSLCTGKEIHCIHIGRQLFVSADLYEKLKNIRTG